MVSLSPNITQRIYVSHKFKWVQNAFIYLHMLYVNENCIDHAEVKLNMKSNGKSPS